MEADTSLKGDVNMFDYDIVKDREHYVVYIEGKFFCTADKLSEAAEEVQNYYAQRR